jgi:hypothetical protein
VLIVASVSCIYGLGSPEAYFGMLQLFEKDVEQPMEEVLRQLAKMQYERTHLDLAPGSFRLRGDSLEIFPPYDDSAVRISFWGDEVERIERIDPVRGAALEELDRLPVYPRTHYVTPRSQLLAAIDGIRAELDERLAELNGQGKLLEAQRLAQRAHYDVEMLRRARLLPGHRELLAPPHRPRAGRAAADPARLLPVRLPVHHRRVARHRAAGRRHVPRRPLAQADPGRLRLPAAVGPRQPAPDLRGVRAADPPGGLRLRHPRPYELAHCERRGGGAADPAHRAARPRGRGAARGAARWTTCWPRSARWWRAASGCW